MKPVLPLCLACLLTLTACGGGTRPAPSPEAEPLSVPLAAQAVQPQDWDLDPADFPTRPTEGSAELWDGSPLYLLSQLPEQEICLYGVGGRDYDGIILQQGDWWAAYELPWMTPRSILPEFYSGDFDADGTEELAILTYTGSGTGVSAWTLTLAEPAEEGWDLLSLPDAVYSDSVSPLFSCSRGPEADQAVISLGESAVTVSLPEYLDPAPDEALEAYVGPIVSYEVEGNTISAHLSVGLHSPSIPYTTCYVADIQAQLTYDGQNFTLHDLTFAEEAA